MFVTIVLSYRIERMCRHSSLDDKEVNEQTMNDRQIVAGLYRFYKYQGKDTKTAARQARVNAIRLLLNEELS